MVAHNVALLNLNNLGHSFFQLNRQEPTIGFIFDATKGYGPTYPVGSNSNIELTHPDVADAKDCLQTRLLVASHLAGYLRGQLESRKGYTATAGISTSKLLAKLVGSVHKPDSQTTLLPPYAAAEHGGDTNVLRFLDSREIRAIPGIGSKLSRKITSHVSTSVGPVEAEDKVMVRDVRLFPGMGPALLGRVLGGPGAPRDIGVRVWGLIHGVDNAEVLQARDLPTQISIEDSYGRLDNFEQARKEMVALAASLIRRMRADLTVENGADAKTIPGSNHKVGPGARDGVKLQWLARPRTIRLSTQPRPPPSSLDNASSRYPGRISHSAPLPQFVFSLEDNVNALAERLVQESLISLFRKLLLEKSGWNLRVLNLAVTNIVEVRTSGRNIENMFQRRQETESKEIIPAHQPKIISPESEPLEVESTQASEAMWEESEEDDEMACVPCLVCGALIPHFAVVAHDLYHLTSGG